MSNSIIVRKSPVANVSLSQGIGNSLTILKSGSLSVTLAPATNATLGGIIVGDNLSITGNGVLSAQPGGVTAFNNRTGNVSLTSNDVTPLIDANYIQVWKDTQATAGTLTQFPKYSSITAASGPIQGYSRGLLTSNTSGTITKTIFDGSLYSSSGSTILQYKSIGFNSNDTGSANSSKSGRLLVGQYGEVMIESSTKVNANTLTTATFDLNATARPSGLSQTLDPHAISAGIHARYGVGTTGGYNPNSSADRVSGGKVAELDLYEIVQLARFNNGTYIGRPGQIYLTATNDWASADPNLAFNHAYDYKTTLSLGESAELVFQNANRTSLRTPNMTDYSILTRGYADTRYQPTGSYLTSANLTYANLTVTPTTLAGYGITDGLTSANLTPYLTISSANSTYAALGHTHSIASVTGLQTALDAKLESANFTYSNLTGTPSTFAPSAHTHAISEVTGLQTALDTKLPSANFTYANLTGTPTLANVATSGSYTDLSNTPTAYSLPTATNTTLGGIKVGANLSISNGVLSAISSGSTTTSLPWANITGKPTLATVATTGSYTDLTNTPASYTLPIATTTVPGGIIVGNNLAIANGVLSAVQNSGSGVPVGAITQIIRNQDNSGWLLCDGSYKNSTDYPLLSALLTPTLNVSSQIMNSSGFGSPVYNGQYYVALSLTTAFKSYDLVNWTQYPLPVSTTVGWNLIYNGSVFFANNVTGTNTLVSSDGQSWTQGTLPATNSYREAAYGNGLFVLAGYNTSSTSIYTSPDGVTWTTRIAPSSQTRWGIIWDGSRFVATSYLGTTSRRLSTSSDGITWTDSALPDIGGGQFRSIAYNGSFYLLGGVNTSLIYKSTDLITWTSSPNIFSGLFQISHFNGLFVIAGVTAATRQLSITQDGVQYRAITTPVYFGGFTVCNSQFTAVSGTTVYSGSVTSQVFQVPSIAPLVVLESGSQFSTNYYMKT